MANLSKLSLPLGYRFLPYDIELVMYYLKRKVAGRKCKLEGDIPDIALENYSPLEIREMSYPKTKYPERFFFSSLCSRYSRGRRKNRSGKGGFWKPTGKDIPIPNKSRTVGWRRTRTFYLGKAPGTITDWHMHEYGLEGENEFVVLCKIFEKKSRGPETDEEYESPVEEDADESCSQVDSGPNKSTGEDVDTPEIYRNLEHIIDPSEMNLLSPGLSEGFLEEEDMLKPMEDEEGYFNWEDFFIPAAADGSNHGTSHCRLAANVTPVLPAHEAMDSCDYENILGYREPTCDSAVDSPLKAGEIVGPYAPQSLARGKQLDLHLGLECISKEGWFLTNVQFLLGSIVASPASATVFPSSLDCESYRVGCGFSCSNFVEDEVTIIYTNDGLLGMSRSFPFWFYFDLAEMLVTIGTISMSIDFMFVFILSPV